MLQTTEFILCSTHVRIFYRLLSRYKKTFALLLDKAIKLWHDSRELSIDFPFRQVTVQVICFGWGAPFGIFRPFFVLAEKGICSSINI